MDVFESLDCPPVAFVEQRPQFGPAGCDVGGGQGEVEFTGIVVAAVVDGVSLEIARRETFGFAVVGADRDVS
ncbi:MAG: hypothetical protein Ta2A_02050 [Treponemataceae bacterium]|nr:MAG: hypothetical protein Ta2A_02050 [Treponemataceae bacterium]